MFHVESFLVSFPFLFAGASDKKLKMQLKINHYPHYLILDFSIELEAHINTLTLLLHNVFP